MCKKWLASMNPSEERREIAKRIQWGWMDNLQTPSSDPLPRLSMRSFGIFPDIKESTLIAATAAIATFPSLTWQLVHLSIYCRFLALFCHLCQPQFRKNLLFATFISFNLGKTPFNRCVHLSHEWSIWKIILVLFLSIDHPSNNWVEKKIYNLLFQIEWVVWNCT